HRHCVNPKYEGVVLHVFLHAGAARSFSRTLSHRLVPQAQLQHGSSVGGVLGPVIPLAAAGRCSRTLEGLSVPRIADVLREAAALRFEQKSKKLALSKSAHGAGEALYQAVVSALGYPGNQLGFKLLAQKLPFQRLAEVSDDAEAMLFGVAGFMPGPDIGGLAGESLLYVKKLWERWWPHRASFHESQIPRNAWCMSGQRPANHPLRRIGTIAVLLRHWRAVRRLVSERDWRGLRLVLGRLTHPFWSAHYTFTSKRAANPFALIGEERVDELLINVFLPFSESWEDLLKMRAPERNSRSRIAAARLLARRLDAWPLLSSAVHQQGILQLYEDFCLRDASNCQGCPFPEQAQKAPHLNEAHLVPRAPDG
ncbi:MAG: DUF2851 family protein, partial [Verrucomicrobiota bacterium]